MYRQQAWGFTAVLKISNVVPKSRVTISGFGFSRIRVQKAVAALQNRFRPAEPSGGEIRRQDPVLRGKSRVQSLGPCAIGQKLQRPGGHAPGNSHRG